MGVAAAGESARRRAAARSDDATDTPKPLEWERLVVNTGGSRWRLVRACCARAVLALAGKQPVAPIEADVRHFMLRVIKSPSDLFRASPIAR